MHYNDIPACFGGNLLCNTWQRWTAVNEGSKQKGRGSQQRDFPMHAKRTSFSFHQCCLGMTYVRESPEERNCNKCIHLPFRYGPSSSTSVTVYGRSSWWSSARSTSIHCMITWHFTYKSLYPSCLMMFVGQTSWTHRSQTQLVLIEKVVVPCPQLSCCVTLCLHESLHNWASWNVVLVTVAIVLPKPDLTLSPVVCSVYCAHRLLGQTEYLWNL